MKKLKNFIALALAFSLCLSCSCKKKVEIEPDTRDPRGSAIILDGKTVVVSIFANDYISEWDFTDENDIKTRENILSDLGVALDYITTESRKWDKNAEFVYDWNENPDLYAERNVPTEGAYMHYSAAHYMRKIISVTFDYYELLEKYDATNVIYMYYYNTPIEETELDATAFANDYSEFSYEYCGFPLYIYGKPLTPSIYAHEILHLFGAPDYYSAMEFTHSITPEYVEYCAEHHPTEIMFKSRCEDETITSELAEITAYYVGWTDKSSEVEQFGLGLSKHIPENETKEPAVN